jgi:hypothetical protein
MRQTVVLATVYILKFHTANEIVYKMYFINSYIVKIHIHQTTKAKYFLWIILFLYLSNNSLLICRSEWTQILKTRRVHQYDDIRYDQV